MRGLTFPTLQEANALESVGAGILCNARSGPFDTVENVLLCPGDKLQFTTRFHDDHYGTVLAVNHGSPYPIKIEHRNNHGDRCITVFSHDEFIRITKVYEAPYACSNKD